MMAPLLALMRGDKVVVSRYDEAPPVYRVRHARPIIWNWTGVSGQAGEPVTCFVEVFARSVGAPCPCCGAIVYNSQNYKDAPDWLPATPEKPLSGTATREGCST